MLETWVPSLGWEDPLEKEMATHSSILAWRIPRTEEPGRLQSIESQKSQTGLGDQTTKQCLALGDPVFHGTPDWAQPDPKSKEALGSQGRGDSRTRVTTDGVPAALIPCFPTKLSLEPRLLVMLITNDHSGVELDPRCSAFPVLGTRNWGG